MKCKFNEDRIIEFAYGELNERDSAAVQAHISSCDGCAQILAGYAFAAGGSGRLQSVPAPSLSSERLRQAILNADLKTKRTWSAPVWGVGALAAAALFFAVLPQLTGERTAEKSSGVTVADVSPTAVFDGALAIGENTLRDVSAQPATTQANVLVAEKPKVRKHRRNRFASVPSPEKVPASTATAAMPHPSDEIVVIEPGAASGESSGIATETRNPLDVPIGG